MLEKTALDESERLGDNDDADAKTPKEAGDTAL